jgi:hypothetical protein
MDKMRGIIEEKNVDKIANEKDLIQKTHFLSRANILFKQERYSDAFKAIC